MTSGVESLLVECIDRIMPIALQITLEKNLEPTYKNILHVVATCGHHWYLALTSTGNFIQLSTGWMYVRQTSTLIADNPAMDEAVLHSIRNISTFSNSKGANLAEICNYIVAAFKFPKDLSSEKVTEKIQCSVNSLKLWGNVAGDSGYYRLSDHLRKDDSPSMSMSLLNSAAPSAEVTVVKRKPEPDFEPEVTDIASLEPGELESDTKESSVNTLLDSDQGSIISSADEFLQPEVSLADTSPVSVLSKEPEAKPFLYASGRYRLFVVYMARKFPKVKLNVEDRIRTVFQKHNLRFGRVIIPPTKSHMAFVEVKEVKDGREAIGKLHHSIQCKGTYRLTVEWAHPSGRDFADLKFAGRRKPHDASPRPSRSRHNRSTSNSRSRSRSSSRQSRSERRHSRTTRSSRSRSRTHRRRKSSPSRVRRRSQRSRSRSRTRERSYRRSRPSSVCSRRRISSSRSPEKLKIKGSMGQQDHSASTQASPPVRSTSGIEIVLTR